MNKREVWREIGPGRGAFWGSFWGFFRPFSAPALNRENLDF